LVNKLRKYDSEEVATLCKSIVKKWKRDIDESSNAPKPATPAQNVKNEMKDKPTLSIEAKTIVKNEKPALTEISESHSESAVGSPVEIAVDYGIDIVKNNRNIKTDNITLRSTGVAVRDKSIEMIYSALATNTNAGTLNFFMFHSNLYTKIRMLYKK
jgi:hypothetical protein